MRQILICRNYLFLPIAGEMMDSKLLKGHLKFTIGAMLLQLTPRFVDSPSPTTLPLKTCEKLPF